VRHLLPQSEREVDLATTGVELGAVAPLDLLELVLQAVSGPGGKERRSGMAALAAAHHDRVPVEVDVLDPQGKALEQAEAAAVEEVFDEAKRGLEAFMRRIVFRTASKRVMRRLLRRRGVEALGGIGGRAGELRGSERFRDRRVNGGGSRVLGTEVAHRTQATTRRAMTASASGMWPAERRPEGKGFSHDCIDEGGDLVSEKR
jgi:hypothetical protein